MFAAYAARPAAPPRAGRGTETESVIERLREELDHPSWEEDTMVWRLRKELK